MQLFATSAFAPPQSLRLRRDRAERILNGLRAAVVFLLTAAALMYAPHLSHALNIANVSVLVPTLLWTVAQYVIWYKRSELPNWLSAVNPIVDVTAVTAIIGGYAVAQSGVLALRSPIFLMYFVVLAGRPVASSVRKAALISVLAFLEYSLLLLWLWGTNRVPLSIDPIAAVQSARVTPLDEVAKLILLGVFGIVSTYATQWVEHLVREASKESAERQRVVTRLVQSELDTLKLQLNPHFLFNALNSAIALIASDPPAAERMVSELSDFLRLVLSTSSEQEVPLERELGLLDRYVAIQRVRFQDRLTVNCNIEDGVRGALVPSLILQPLVENAIRHGISPRAGAGYVQVTARRVGDKLAITILDDGVGVRARRSRERSRGSGLGLTNTTTRLMHLYGEHHEFESGPRAEGGYAVRISIPFKLGRVSPVRAGAEPRTDNKLVTAVQS
ncbi:MAG TPA: histidine kinase [Gemmatimonadaceae bacterium]|nr:histidine kinase [Gemmatimonadaceae bacterium]